MYRRVMAFDFDGTIAVEGRVPVELERALEQCRASGHALFLVTGRRFETVPLGTVGKLFDGIVWENGAVLSHTASGEIYLPFGQLDPRLIKALKEAAVPFDQGLAIAATWAPHDQAVWRVLASQGGGASVEYNKGAVMLIPPGAAKGAGLERLLGICGYSARNLASFGDAENDLSMLALAEVAVAVGDAVPAVRDMADLVSTAPGPQGVVEVLQSYPLAGRFFDQPLRRERPIAIGEEAGGRGVTIPASRLVGRNFGVFGDSGTGKSWMVGLLAEGLHHEEYQILIIDPEGDFRGLRVLPRCIALEGDESSLPSPSVVVSLLEAGAVSVVLDLSGYPVDMRAPYVEELLRSVRPLRERKYRPHWIALDEAQHFLSPGGNVMSSLLPLLKDGGVTVVSYRPDRLDPSVLRLLHNCLITRLTDPEAVHTVCGLTRNLGLAAADFKTLTLGNALLCDGQIARLRPAVRRVPHIRHLYKYLDTPLPPGKRFWFRDARGAVGAEAASLYEFLQLLPVLPLESLAYHDRRHDFLRWAETTLGDAGLASRLRKIANRQLSGEELREALLQTISQHYAELSALR